MRAGGAVRNNVVAHTASLGTGAPERGGGSEDRDRAVARPGEALPLAASALVLTATLGSYATSRLPFDAGLYAQTAAITLALVIVSVRASRRGVRSALRAAPSTIRLGLGLYAAAAAWGAAVGVASGNPLRHVVAQTLSMALLAWGATVLLGDRRIDARWLAGVLSAAAVLAAAVHLAVLLQDPGFGSFRFRLRHDATFTPAALLALVFSLGWHSGERRALAALGALASAFLLLGGMSRGAWLAAAVTLVVGIALSLASPGSRTRLRGGLFAIVLIAAAAVVLVAWAGRQGRPLATVVFAEEGAGQAGLHHPAGAPTGRCLGDHDALTLVQHDAVQPLRSIEASVAVRGGRGDWARLIVLGSTATGARVFRHQGKIQGAGDWMPMRLVARIPSNVERLTIFARAGRGSWCFDHPRVLVYDSRLAGWIRALSVRAHSLVFLLGEPEVESTFSYRLSESAAVARRLRAAGPLRLALGHGLGATFPFTSLTWEEGRRASRTEANFIHNFYLFLAFKLGAAGIAALAGLALFPVTAARDALRIDAWAARAAASAWIGYLVWSVSSPEILDFRMAPVWGAVVAVATNEAQMRASTATPPGEPGRGSARRRSNAVE